MLKIWEHDHQLWLHKDLGLKYPTSASARRDSNDTRHLKRDFRYPSRSSNRRPPQSIRPCIYRYSSLLSVAFFVLQTWIYNCITHSFIFLLLTSNIGPLSGFLDHTHTDTRRTPLDKWSARRPSPVARRPSAPTTQHINTRDKHSCPERDSNPRQQQRSNLRPTP
jgi:hypothetical protein